VISSLAGEFRAGLAGSRDSFSGRPEGLPDGLEKDLQFAARRRDFMEARMKVILIENVPSLGKAGDVVQVATGYGRNFLIPKKLALEASSANVNVLKRQQESFLKTAAGEKEKAAELAAKIETLSCTVTRQAGENEKLFGSVTSMDIQEFLTGQGISLDRRKIFLPNPIKTLGSFTVPVKLHPEVTAQLKVDVTPAAVEKKT
jgi:large subunit ribosomal protein L9